MLISVNLSVCNLLFKKKKMREADKEPFACCGFCVPAGVCAARVRQWWLLMTQTFTHFLFWHILWIFLSGKKNFFLFVFFYTKLTIEAQRCLSRSRSFHFHCSTKISNEIIARREPDWLFTGCCGSTRDCESVLEVKEQQVTVWCWRSQTQSIRDSVSSKWKLPPGGST